MAKRLKQWLLPLFLISMFIISSSLLAQGVDPTLPTQPDSSILALDNMDSANEGSNLEGGLQLNAIYFNTNNPRAIINGKVVGINESIEGYKVISIGPQFVKLISLKGENLVLAIDNLDVKNFHRNPQRNTT